MPTVLPGRPPLQDGRLSCAEIPISWLPKKMSLLGAALLGLCCLLCLGVTCAATTRHYYIAAEDVMWDFAPSGQDLLHGVPIPQPWSAKTSWAKTRYIEYTDSTFKVRKPQPEWLGILGPIIRAEVGDSIVVEFLNRGRLPHSIHPHGLRYDKANEGSYYLPIAAGARIAPGGHFTYHWFADAGSGPGPGDASSVVWWYHSHTDEAYAMNAGLLGAIIVTAKGKARPDGTPKGVDQEFVTMFMIFDEMRGNNAGQFHSINGYVFGNLPGLIAKNGDHVRWYLMGMGNEKDLHTPHWHAKTVLSHNRHTDVIELLPASMVTADMVADNPGTWLFHCQVADHMEAGMMATYTIYEPPKRSCPLKFASGDFWNPTADTFSLAVENQSNKSIKSMILSADNLLTSNFRRQSFSSTEWRDDRVLPSHQQHVLNQPAYLKSFRDKIVGWILFPKIITYSDGTVWTPQQADECFHVFWRDPDHPDLKALPPRQIETNED